MSNRHNFETEVKNDELSVEELNTVSAAGITLTATLVEPVTLSLASSGSPSSSSGGGSSSNLGYGLAQSKSA